MSKAYFFRQEAQFVDMGINCYESNSKAKILFDNGN